MGKGTRAKTEAERRSYTRFPAEIQVDYTSGDTFLFSYITNISEMGIFIRSDDPLPVGTDLRLRFASDEDRLELSGEVMWVNPVKLGPDNLNPGMGVRFRDLDVERRERVVALVRTVAYLPRQAHLLS
ncbi:MAG: TIGR02266 family protein [Sandaracinaceae bacterium]